MADKSPPGGKMREKLAKRIESRAAHVGVVGLGYVGLPMAVEFANVGFQVTGFERDRGKIDLIRSGKSYVEDVPGTVLAEMVRKGRLDATDDFRRLSEADVIYICVPTPLTKTKDPDVSFIISAFENIKAVLRRGHLVVLGSTTYPGTTEELFLPILEETGLHVGEDFFLAFSPERIDPGNREVSIRDVPKVVGGKTPVCTALAVALFEKVFKEVVPVSSTQSAEMVKLLENTFRAINIGLANEVAIMCSKLGLDVWEVIEAAASKPYGFMKFAPGPGLGGHCIPVDPAYLAWKLKAVNYRARFIELASEVNSEMPNVVVDLVTEALNSRSRAVRGAKILVLGVAYKKDVGDVRESPALDILRLLDKRGAELRYSDPFVPEIAIDSRRLRSEALSEGLLQESDCVVIVTDHSGVDYRLVVEHADLVVDTRNATRDAKAPPGRVFKL